MNPILGEPKRACLAVAKHVSLLSRSKQRHFDMRFVRLLLILGAIGCGLSYWHERFEHPLTDDAYIPGRRDQSRRSSERASEKDRNRR